MSTTEENKATARTFLDMINAQDLAGYASVCSPELAKRWELITPQAYARWGTHHIGITGMLAEGDEVWCSMTNDGGHIATWEGIPPTGTHWTIDGIFFMRFADGKIVEQRGLFDWLPVVKQLGGTITPPAG